MRLAYVSSLAGDLGLQSIQQSLDIVAIGQSLLLNVDNALLDVCPLSLGCGVELCGANDLDPCCGSGISLGRRGIGHRRR